jgi:hypothetical protein
MTARRAHADPALTPVAGAESMTLNEWVAYLVATAPPLTPEQIDRLRRLLPPVRYARTGGAA